jgi:adhesin transport system outer membrane protein
MKAIRLCAWALMLSIASPWTHGQARTGPEQAGLCVTIDPAGQNVDGPGESAQSSTPRERLASLVREAIQRSKAVGASALLAEAALSDLEETRSAKGPQASLSAGAGPSVLTSAAATQSSPLQVQGSIQVSQVLYDGGRLSKLIDWRAQLAEAARQGLLSAQEQLALNTVSLALERSRYRQHVLIYGQYVGKMACLVQALEAIVASDRGRASELVQARKSLQQAELSQAQAQSQVRQVEVRLRRLVGEGLSSAQGLSTVLLQVPAITELAADIHQSADLQVLKAQADAADKFAQSVEASAKPQVTWVLGGNTNTGLGSGSAGLTGQRTSGVSIGVNVSIPLLNPAQIPATEAARKRARAALMQRDEAVESRMARLNEIHEQTVSSFDRARRVGSVLKDSEQLRNSTVQQWQLLGRRSLFDVMATEGEHYSLRVQHANALHDGQQANALLLSLGSGIGAWLK